MRKPSTWRRLRSYPSAILGGFIITLVLTSALFAPLLAPHQPEARNIRERFNPPTIQHPLGTDNFGRDILTRILYGARISLQVAVTAVTIAAALGIFLGAIAGYFGGTLDQVIMRVVDVFLAFPPILLALLLVAAIGSSAFSVTLALGLIYWTAYARVIRSSILALKTDDFVEANRALGANWPRTLFRHVLPNAFGPVIVVASIGMGNAVTAEAALSFLGLGVQPPTPSWGSMLNSGLQFLRQAPHLATFPGAAIMLTVLGFNLLGDGLRDALDPRGNA